VSALAYFRPRPDYALGRSFLLAFAVHLALIAVMFLGVRWQSHPTESVTVELWDPPPPPPPAPVVEAPKPPPPKVEPPKPKPEPEPEVKKPEIVEKVVPPKPEPKPKPKPEPKPEPKPKPKPEPKAEVKPKPVPPKDDEFQKRMAREQLAMEQRKMDEERRRIAAERAKAEGERLARELAASARNKALNDYIGRIRAKVRQNWILPQELQGDPEAIFNVVQLPTGEVISVKLAKSSGNAAYDAAVERAILKSSPLPLPDPRSLFSRELKLTFRPRD
jgi:colicin import membrane protein